ncbi:MAG: heme exporter protein CcmB [Dehalococcoidia bacterium]|nr:heme exporter protein CcmB [Dehalococcoidia bacterium]
MKGLLSKVVAILWKDVVSELRTKEVITSVFVFALLVLVCFSFAFEPDTGMIELVAPGMLWVCFTFAGLLGLNRGFAAEKENACFEGLMLCPVDRVVVYLGKLAGGFTFMLVVEAIVTPIFLVLFGLPIFVPELALIIVLATLGFAAVGTLFSALAMNTRARDILLPMVFLPVVVPVIIAGVKTTALVLQGRPWGDMAIWFQIMVAFDIIYLVVSALVFEFVIEE